MKKVNFLIISALILAIVNVGGCVESRTKLQIPQESYVLIGQGALFGSGEEGIVRQNLVITDDVSWQNLVSQMNTRNNVSDGFTETNIDFNTYEVIAVFDEVKGNGGWTIDITSIEYQANQIVVSVTNLTTGNVSSVITQPYQIVKIPVSNKEIVFETNYKNLGE